MVDKKLKKILRLSIDISKKSDLRSRHVSFLVKKNRILAIGFNRKKTHGFAHRSGYKYPSIHSELDCIKALRQDAYKVRGSVLINVRVSRDGQRYMLSRPCPACLKLARLVGVRSIVFTDGRGGFSSIN